jgi:hypothetical protein
MAERPDTLAGALREAAEWLDLADVAFDVLAEIGGVAHGPIAPSSDEIQRELRAMADVLDDPFMAGSKALLDYRWKTLV